MAYKIVRCWWLTPSLNGLHPYYDNRTLVVRVRVGHCMRLMHFVCLLATWLTFQHTLTVTMLVSRHHSITLLLLILADVLTQVVGTSTGSHSPVNDDNWHTVFLRREADVFQLTVDDRGTAPVTGLSYTHGTSTK